MIKLLVLGTAQDGGIPHLGCRQPYCERARRDPHLARWVACLGLIDTEARRSFLIDATPDARPQLDYLTAHPDAPARQDRNPVDGLILTHAHIGHYTGLIQFGREVMATRQMPTYGTARMGRFLIENGPWAQLVRDGHLSLREITDQQPARLTDRLTITPFLVPHRQEWSDTIGLEIAGPQKRVIYIPDIDRWDDWNRDIREVVAACDIALLDGCFYSADEVGGRPLAEIPHPLIPDTMERLAALSERVYFTHLNHTNSAADRASAQRREIEARGFRVAEDRMEFAL
ncbi:MAG: MBL fold metallo-hydrolase [Chloroflexi bacterium]|nr:MBL fold metallo-hydrolase [Chloroflexota bacterium]